MSGASSPDRMRSALHRTSRTIAPDTPRSAEVPRVKPVRSTLDLPPAEHLATKRLVLDLGAPSLVALVRALLTLAREDPEVTERLRAQLRVMRAQRWGTPRDARTIAVEQ